MTDPPQLDELGFYVLAGAPRSPADMLTELADGERLRFGTTLISEPFNIKEAVTLSGAAAAATSTLGIATGVIMHGATPVELEPVVAAYRRLRPPGRFDALAANPGRSPR
jgi:alkanesulfonate monooxygenase SsuD/methylene tetrahydromethanopterin reductase-like flavin-dependent oxidoreductase (luciferase family)